MSTKRKHSNIDVQTTLEFICDPCGVRMGKNPCDIYGGTWCQHCPKPKQCVTLRQYPTEYNSFAYVNPIASSRWVVDLDVGTTPYDYSNGSSAVAIFECDRCKHHVKNRILECKTHIPCIYCNGLKLCPDKDCTVCFKRSLASFPDISRIWNNDLNVITPRQILSQSGKKYWFNCKDCHHTYSRTPRGIHNSNVCYYCTGHRLCDKDDCTTCYMNSFAFTEPHLLVGFMYGVEHKNKNKRPRDIFPTSTEKYMFMCQKCNHASAVSIVHITKMRTGCGYCLGRLKCDRDENCAYCISRSFEGFHDQDKVNSLSKTLNKGITAYDLFMNAGRRVIFDCFKCDRSFKKSVFDVTRKRKQWCPRCTNYNRMMHGIETTLKSIPDVTYETEEKIITGGRNLYWDVVVKHGNMTFYIESDGPQHFSTLGMMKVSRSKDYQKSLKKYKDQRDRDTLKDLHIKHSDGLLFRVNFNQLDEIERIVYDMVERSKNKETGVISEHSLYENREPV